MRRPERTGAAGWTKSRAFDRRTWSAARKPGQKGQYSDRQTFRPAFARATHSSGDNSLYIQPVSQPSTAIDAYTALTPNMTSTFS